VNTRHEVVKGPKSHNVTLERVGLYHYSIKSMEDFKMKMARGSGGAPGTSCLSFGGVHGPSLAGCMGPGMCGWLVTLHLNGRLMLGSLAWGQGVQPWRPWLLKPSVWHTLNG
jgi:hypothetical protein